MSISSIGGAGFSPSAYSSVSRSPIQEDTSARGEFDKFQSMSPAQKMRAIMLAKLGLTEEQVKAMTPEERKKVEDKIKDMVKQQYAHGDKTKQQSGLLADVTA